MPRPATKAQLIEQTRAGYAALQKEIDSLSPEEMTAPGVVGAWSVKDVLAHLMAWQHMVQAWYAAGKRGETPVTPSEKYTWREIPALNQEIFATYRDHALDDVRAGFAASHQVTLDLIEATTDAELFTPKVYTWTKTTTLGSYLTSATCSHYDWARKEIRRGLKAWRQRQPEE
jgi:hypothetical protein